MDAHERTKVPQRSARDARVAKDVLFGQTNRNYCLTRRSVSVQEEGWGVPRRIKRETARPHPMASGSVTAASTRDASSEICVAETAAGGATIGSGVSPTIESRRTTTVSCTNPALLASYSVSCAVESMSVKWSENPELIVYVPAPPAPPAPSVARTTVPRATTVAYTTSVSSWTAGAESWNVYIPLRSSVLRSTGVD